MAETETTATPAPGTTTASPAAVPATPSSFVNADGTFKEGWQEAFVPEDLRHLGVFKSVTNITTAMKQLGHLDMLRGKQGKGVIPPDEKATPTEWDMFFKAIGRPDSPDGYEFKAPEDLADYYDASAVKDAMAELHKAGLTKKQVAAVMALDAKRVSASLATQTESAKTQRADAEKALRTKWGAAFDERLHIANRMISENVAEADRPAVLERIGNDPIIADFLATVGKKFMEDSPPNPDQASGALTPAEANQKMQELIAEQNADPKMRAMNPAKWTRLNGEIRRLAALATAGR